MLAPGYPPTQPAEAEVAVRGEGAHRAPFGERERLAIVSLGPLSIEAGRVRGDVPK
jgi:hypothetical protein